MRVRWTPEALNDLNEIEIFISEDNPERAITFVDELIDFGENLSNFPEKGTQEKWTTDKTIKEFYYKGYTFIYELFPDEVRIHEVHSFYKMMRHFNR